MPDRCSIHPAAAYRPRQEPSEPQPGKVPVKCKALTDRLLADFSIYVQPINYPTVPKGTERLRLTPGPLHGELEISKLVAALDQLWTEMMLQRAA